MVVVDACQEFSVPVPVDINCPTLNFSIALRVSLKPSCREFFCFESSARKCVHSAVPNLLT
jgi:hypothetical protein